MLVVSRQEEGESWKAGNWRVFTEYGQASPKTVSSCLNLAMKYKLRKYIQWGHNNLPYLDQTITRGADLYSL